MVFIFVERGFHIRDDQIILIFVSTIAFATTGGLIKLRFLFFSVNLPIKGVVELEETPQSADELTSGALAELPKVLDSEPAIPTGLMQRLEPFGCKADEPRKSRKRKRE